MVNVQIVFLFGILLALSLGSTIGSVVRTARFGDDMWYLLLNEQGSKAKIFIEDMLTFIILYNNLIPIRYGLIDLFKRHNPDSLPYS
jgi:phospholipid-transporting ATPase